MATAKKRRFSKDGLFLRGRVWWTRLPEKGRVPTPIKDPSAAGRELARQWRTNQLKLIADPGYARAQTTTVGTAVTDAIDAHRIRKGRVEKRVTEKTMKYYSQKLGHFVDFFGPDRLLHTVDYDAVGLYIKKREADPGAANGSKLSIATLGKELKEIRFMLNIQGRRGAYPHNVDFVTRKGEYSEEGEEKTRTLAWSEIPRLVHSIVDIKPAVALSPKQAAHQTMRAQQLAWHFATGVRMSESMHAEMKHHVRSDANGEVRWRVYIDGTKSKKAKAWISIAPAFNRWLEFSLRDRPKTGKIFQPWSNFNRALKRAAERCGIDRLSTNDIRRTASTLLSEAGIGNEVLKDVFRHTTTAMLDKYYVKRSVAASETALAEVQWPEDVKGDLP